MQHPLKNVWESRSTTPQIHHWKHRLWSGLQSFEVRPILLHDSEGTIDNGSLNRMNEM